MQQIQGSKESVNSWNTEAKIYKKYEVEESRRGKIPEIFKYQLS